MSEKIGEFISGSIVILIFIGLPIYAIIDAAIPNKAESSEAKSITQESSEPLESVNSDTTYTEADDDYVHSDGDYYDYLDSQDYGEYQDFGYDETYDAYSDLDCADIGYEHYVEYGDPHGLDGDYDGIACEGW